MRGGRISPKQVQYLTTELQLARQLTMGSQGSKTREPSREDLGLLLRQTNYDKETICAWYSAFSRHSGGGNVMKVEDMLRMCSRYEGGQLTEDRLARLFCEGEERGEVRFTNFLTDHYVTTRGSQRDKLARLFRLCDSDRDGFISGEDLTDTLAAWDKDTGRHQQVRELIFSQEERNISQEQFIRQCELLISDQALQVLL